MANPSACADACNPGPSPDLIGGHNCTGTEWEPLLSEVGGRLEWVDEWTANVYVDSGEATMFRSERAAACVDVSAGFESRISIDLDPHPREAADRTADVGSSEELEALGRWRRAIRTRARRARDGSADARGTQDRPEDVERTARRRRGRVRRLCVSNRVGYLSTLTYRGEGQFEWAAMARDVRNFRRRVRARFPGLKGPILTVPEWHPKGHGLHVHVGTAEYVPQELLAACWPHGFVDNGERRRRRSGTQLSPLRAARYVSKYLSKAQEGGRPPWGHAYEITQGHQPHAVRLRGLGQGGVEVAARALLGGADFYVWDSSTCAGWAGPPAAWLACQETSPPSG